MKRSILSVILLFAATFAGAREVININRNWKFFSAIENSSDNARSVNLPHTWNNDALSGKKDYFRGIGNYIRDIDIPLNWRNKRVFIRFHGAGTVTDLLVNGRHVGQHRGGYSAFTFEITSYLNYGGKNTFWVLVNNASQVDVLPTGGDINIYGGLYRDVELIVSEPSMVSLVDNSGDGVYFNQKLVSEQRAEVEAEVKIDGLSDRTLEVDLSVYDAERNEILAEKGKFRVPVTGSGEINIPFAIDNPRLWNGTIDPYMYRVVVKLTDDGYLSDSVMLPLGLRSFAVDPKQGFMLNGKPYPLRGVAYYEDRALVGNAITPYQVSEDMDFMLEMGVNAVRAAAYQHHKDFYRACDRNGIIVWSDIPLLGVSYLTDIGYVDSEGFLANGRQQLQETIDQLYNHPSVVMWGLFSNLTYRGDDPASYIEELNSIAMLEDPGRLTVASSSIDGKINFITDLIAWNHSFGWTEGLPSDIRIWLEQTESAWGSLCSAVSYGAGASILHQDDKLERPNPYGSWHPERWQSYFHEQYFTYLKDANFLWGVFVNNMFDYGAAGREWGDGTGVDDKGLVTFDRKYPKDAFYFYKANWNREEPFVAIAEKRWNKRANTTQTIKVYSNEEEVELFVNGESKGVKPGIDGTFMWPEIKLPEGVNLLEARSGDSRDRVRIEIDLSLSVHRIQ